MRVVDNDMTCLGLVINKRKWWEMGSGWTQDGHVGPSAKVATKGRKWGTQDLVNVFVCYIE